MSHCAGLGILAVPLQKYPAVHKPVGVSNPDVSQYCPNVQVSGLSVPAGQ